jgi:hypothetical protein
MVGPNWSVRRRFSLCLAGNLCRLQEDVLRRIVIRIMSSLQLAELVHAYTQLRQNFVEEGRPDLISAVDWDRNSSPVMMDPALMTSSLPAPLKNQAAWPRGGTARRGR